MRAARRHRASGRRRAGAAARRLRGALLAVVLSLAAGPVAWADGDPAGDVLIQQNVFYGSKLDLRSKEAAQLMALTEQAKEKGYEIRVAALTVPEDLGAIGYLWDDPTNYADFLTAEIQAVYRERTLVVMPAGLGIWWRDHDFADEQAILDELGGPGTDPSKVMPLAMEAIVKLAAAQDIELTIPDVEPPPGGVTQPASHYQQGQNVANAAGGAASAPESGGGSWLFALPALIVVVAAGFILVRRRLSSSA
ncbi:MAG TPA: hypothetical protein VFZ00_10180 [Solirubrobacter sp.]|nr:hypothetical protein [Solirubrobacter sp.]